MALYIDGFVLAVPKKNTKKYQKIAKLCAKVWVEHGALEYCEYMADDVPEGKKTSFSMSVKRKSDELVWFAYIVYKSKAHRDRVNKKVFKDPRMQAMQYQAFDMTRMIYGGFKSMVLAKKKK